jgi:integrase-like protein
VIADRVWRTRPQLELATVEYIGLFNHDRLHSALGHLTPAEYEPRYARPSGPLRATTAPAVIEGTLVPAGLSAR